MSKTIKKYYEKDMIKMDLNEKFISFSNKKLFYDVFSENLEILELFILSQLELDIDVNDCDIQLDDMDMICDNIEDCLKIHVVINGIGVNLFVKRICLSN